MVWETIDREKLSPMMRHYVSIKEKYSDCLILYRLGDFYEMFFDDAIVGSRILELTLTGRDCGLEERCPMAGVPQHVIETYAAKLVSHGKKVCLVDQIEDPKEAVGLVKRAVTRILTPGTLTDGQILDATRHNFFCVAFLEGESLGLAIADLSTGALRATAVQVKQEPSTTLDAWMESLHPAEIALVDSASNEKQNDALQDFLEKRQLFTSRLPQQEAQGAMQKLKERLNGPVPKEIEQHPTALGAVLGLFDVVYAFQDERLAHLSRLQWMRPERTLEMNAATRAHLELTQNLDDGGRRNTLLHVLDQTKTAMGSRMMAEWISFPLLDPTEISERLDLVETFVQQLPLRLQLREQLDPIYDLERLLSRLSYHRGNGRDLLNFAHSVAPIPAIRALLKSVGPVGSPLLNEIQAFEALHDAITRAIVDEPPMTVNEGGLIRAGYSEALDRMKEGSEEARARLMTYENEQREKTGIKNLRVVYRKNQGYFIEVTRSNMDRVPAEYQRRQTLKNAERYSTDALEEQANRIIGSAARIEQLEYEIFVSLRDQVAEQALKIQQTADALARLDVLLSLANIAAQERYVRPKVGTEGAMHIEGGRHPVIEHQTGQDFIPNDLEIGTENNQIHLITGPNMAGKSTYMRQNALIVIMAQMGSFVPATACEIPVVDRLFTRIGARDRLARGESTFMVEMQEMAAILHEATPRSFLILDEVGRGTSTNDGLSIAYAILEYLAVHLPAKTLFATHYHELVALEKDYPTVRNKTVSIEEQGGALVFLRKVVDGTADRSYGIEVARLSGMPREILDRADQLLIAFESDATTELPPVPLIAPALIPEEITHFLEETSALDINALTPMEAMLQLDQLIHRARALAQGNEKGKG